jgi:hypothetical protein
MIDVKEANPDSTARETSVNDGMPDVKGRVEQALRSSPPVLWNLIRSMVLVVGVVGLHYGVHGGIPSGPDGGNWLALAQEMRGIDVMASRVTYPPVFPGFLALLLGVLGPIDALLVAAVTTKTALVFAVYLVARPMGRMHGFLSAVIVGAAAAWLEAYAWGAYPQTLATAFALLAMYLGCRSLETRSTSQIACTALLVIATVLTHLLVGGLLMLAIPTAFVYCLIATRAGRADWVRAIALGSVVMALGSLYLGVAIFGEENFKAPVNPMGHDLVFSLLQQIREAPVPWAILATLAIVGLFHRTRSGDQIATKAGAVSWVIVGVGFFAITGEARSLLITQIGVVILAIHGFDGLWRWTRAIGIQQWSSSPLRQGWKVLSVFGIALLSSLIVTGVMSYPGATGWFRVVEARELRALDALGELAGPDDIAIATSGNHGHPFGWWVQGYAGVPTYSGIDPRWLAFPDERDQAEVANSVFFGGLTLEEVDRTLEEEGVDFLVVDRRSPDGDWMTNPVSQEFPVLYQSHTVVILGAKPIDDA